MIIFEDILVFILIEIVMALNNSDSCMLFFYYNKDYKDKDMFFFEVIM